MSPPRVEWARDGSALLVRIGNGVRIVDDTGAIKHIPVNRPALDARWLGELVLAFDAIGMLRWHRIDGAVVDQHAITFSRAGRDSATAASISGDGRRIAIVSASDVDGAEHLGVWSAEGEKLWAWKPRRLGMEIERGRMEIERGRTSAALSDDGRLIAIGYATHAERGWVVIQLATEVARARDWRDGADEPGPMALAFDRRGNRFIHASPEAIDDVGPIRVGRGFDHARDHRGGARCVALDDRGVLAGYGYAVTPPGARGRIVVDYLSSAATGGAAIEIVDTMSIDPSLADVAAIAFAPDARRIACLASDGSLEIVPVP